MTEWGPLQALVGEWEAEGGLDTAFSHARNEVIDTPYLEKLTMKPFGPVENGRQSLYGLDYKSAMWRGSEDNPFHTEVGYWLWDEATGEVLRGFVVPRDHRARRRHRRGRCDGVHDARRARRHQLHDRREPVPREEREHDQLRGHDHHQRRQLVVPRDDHAEDDGVPRAVRAHRSQHAATRRLSTERLRDPAPAPYPTRTGSDSSPCSTIESR